MQWADGSIRSCLVPYASLLNHSPSAPHIVRYSRLDPSSNSLHFSLFRPCAAGRQCYLSYGSLPNEKLLLFYGMALPDNPQNRMTIQLKVSHAGTCNSDAQMMCTTGISKNTEYCICCRI